MFSLIVSELAANPRNVGPLLTATHHGVAGTPGEGPYMALWFEVVEGRIAKAAFQTYGCPSSVACGSMTTLLLTGRTIEQALRLEAKDVLLAVQGVPEGKEHCAGLAITALVNALGED